MSRLATAWSALAAATTLAVAGCDSVPPTALAAPAAAAPTENHGNGAQFVIVTGATSLITLVDEEGDVCDIGFSPQEGGKTRSDFFRTNPDGSLSVHATDPEAPLTIEYQGLVYTGVGHAMAMARTDAEGFNYVKLVVNATGKVLGPDGEVHHARCMGHLEDDGVTLRTTIVVH